MYICLDKESNLPRNTYLEWLAGYSEVPVYGDAFVFSMEPWLSELDRSKGARWAHMPDWWAAGEGSPVIATTLPKLLRCLPKPKKDEEK